tara:strand:+ start:331 stop:1173 length:843 start_codon:yes stop_codon:yes gene_type:complete
MEFVKLVGPFGVFFIMFALGLNLNIKRFINIFKYPKNFIVGFICQTIILPFIALIIIKLQPMEKEFQIGIILLLVMPSAAMSNYATRIANGNVPLSITLTSLCALISFITVPLYLNIFTKFFNYSDFSLNLFSFALKNFLFITLPVLFGIFCREKFPKFFIKHTFTLDRAAFVIFLTIVFIAIYTEKDNLVSYFYDVGVTMSLILVLVFASSFLITQLFIKDLASKRAVRIEAILQNGAMGFVVGSLIFNEIQYLVPIAIYALLQYCFLLFYLGNINLKN